MTTVLINVSQINLPICILFHYNPAVLKSLHVSWSKRHWVAVKLTWALNSTWWTAKAKTGHWHAYLKHLYPPLFNKKILIMVYLAIGMRNYFPMPNGIKTKKRNSMKSSFKSCCNWYHDERNRDYRSNLILHGFFNSRIWLNTSSHCKSQFQNWFFLIVVAR